MAIKMTSRKPNTANKRSHALNSTKKQQKLNLQVVRLNDGTKIRLSAREIRTLNKGNKIEIAA